MNRRWTDTDGATITVEPDRFEASGPFVVSLDIDATAEGDGIAVFAATPKVAREVAAALIDQADRVERRNAAPTTKAKTTREIQTPATDEVLQDAVGGGRATILQCLRDNPNRSWDARDLMDAAADGRRGPVMSIALWGLVNDGLVTIDEGDLVKRSVDS